MFYSDFEAELQMEIYPRAESLTRQCIYYPRGASMIEPEVKVTDDEENPDLEQL